MAESNGTCCIDGCGKQATRVGARMCEMHYTRQRRNGTTDYVGGTIPGNLTHSNGYQLAAAPEHPRALGGYRAYEHRVVFTDAHGEGPFKCHWCGVTVTWDDMHVDHLDDDRANNDKRNLVASCPRCNQARGVEKMKATYRQRNGVTHEGVTRTLQEWADHIGISRPSLLHRIKTGWPMSRALTGGRGKAGPKARAGR